MLIEEWMGLGGHGAARLGSAQVWRRAGGGRGVAGVVRQVHEGLSEVVQGIERILQELRGLQGSDGLRRHVGHGRRVLGLLLLLFDRGHGLLHHLGRGQRGDVGLGHAGRQGLVVRLLALLPRVALLLLLGCQPCPRGQQHVSGQQ